MFAAASIKTCRQFYNNVQLFYALYHYATTRVSSRPTTVAGYRFEAEVIAAYDFSSSTRFRSCRLSPIFVSFYFCKIFAQIFQPYKYFFGLRGLSSTAQFILSLRTVSNFFSKILFPRLFPTFGRRIFVQMLKFANNLQSSRIIFNNTVCFVIMALNHIFIGVTVDFVIPFRRR